MKNKLFKFFRNFAIFLMIAGILFSNIPFNALSFLIDSYEKTSGIVDKMWLVEQNHNSDVVDKFESIRSVAEKIKIYNAMAAVANDAASESHTGTIGSTSAASFSWTHTPVGTPRGVLVFVTTISATKYVTSVTYGGVAMTEITGGAAVDTTTEPGRIDTFFLGASVPTGARTIVVNRTNNATIMYAAAATQTAGANTEVYLPGIVLLQNNGTFAVQSVTDGSTGVNSVRYAAGYTGGAAPVPAGTGSTLLNSIDLGAYGTSFARETTAGQGARNVGFNYTTSDDRAAVHLAVREMVADTTPPTPSPMTFATAPNNTTATQIDMTATTATDVTTPPVSYYFALDTTVCTAANIGTGAADSAWQSGTTYSDIGLAVNKCYGYKVKARDSVGTPNETGLSGITTLYTSANTPSAPTVGSPTQTTLVITNNENGNPTANPSTEFAVQVTTADANWNGKWANVLGNASASEVWLPDSTLTNFTVNGLTGSTQYDFNVKARNNDGDETGLSTAGSGTTSAPAVVVTASSIGTQTVNMNSGATAQSVTAAFRFQQDTGTAVNITALTLTDTGSVIFNSSLSEEVSNVSLSYKTGVASTCPTGAETVVGNGTLGVGAENVSWSGLTIPATVGPTNYTCVFITLDAVGIGPIYPAGGGTIDLQISAGTNFTLSSGTTAGTFPVNPTGATTVLPTADSVTYAVSPDGGRSGNTATISGKGFGAPSLDADQQDCVTATVGTKGCVRFIVGGADTVEGTDISTWNNTTIIFTVSATGLSATNGGAAALEVVAAAQATATDLIYFIYPNITSVAVTTGNCTLPGGASTTCTNANREGDSITLEGDHFGAAQGDGSITFQGGFAPSQIGPVTSWGATAVAVTIPTAIDNNDYTGDIRLLRDSAISAKDDIWTSFRILPRVASTSHATNPNLKGGRGDSGVSINGDHLCQTGTCPTAFSAADSALFAPDGATANITAGASAWTDISVPSITIPTDATDGSLAITSNTTYVSNYLTFDIKFAPTTPTNPINDEGGSNNPTLSASAFADPSDSPADSQIGAEWQVRHNTDTDWLTPEWTRTPGAAEASIIVNTTNGTFANGDAGQTAFDCGTAYRWRVRYRDNGGVTSQEFSAYSAETADFVFTTAACGPDATSSATSPAELTDGARLGQTVVITGTTFGTVSPGSRANCIGGAGTGCVKINGTGGYILADTDISAWGDTSITFVLPVAVTGYGGATTAGLIVYAAGVSDPNGLTFYIYPDITSLSVVEAREGDVITINGNKFGTGTTGAAVTIVGAASTIPGDLVIDVSCDGTDGWAETCIKITITTAIADATDSGYVIVTQGTGSNNKLTNSTDAQANLAMLPRIVSLSPPADAPDSVSAWQASSITVNGSHFAAYNATNSRVAVNGSTVDPGSGSWGVSAITLIVPAAATNNGVLQATRGDLKTSNNSATFYVLPKIISTGPTTGEAREGDAITITGNHFCGTCANLPTIRFYNAGQTVDATANSGASATSLAVTVPATLADTINSYNLEIVRSAAGGQDDGKSSTNTTRNNFTYTILPDITDVSNPTAYTNAAREYSAVDSDGVITVNGNHFGAAGTVTVLGCGATDCVGSGVTQVITGTCTGTAYQATCVGIQIPNTSLSDSLYLGNIVLTRTSDSKTDTYGGGVYRILPRITSLSPNSGITNAPIVIIGNHFCQTGTCPLVGSRSTASDNVIFNSGVQVTDGNVTAWGHGDSSTSGVNVNVPSTAITGNVVVKSNTTYDSNGVNFTKQSSVPSDPTSLEQDRNDGTTSITVGNKTADGVTNNLVFKALMSGLNPSTLCLQIENATVGTAFTGTVTAEETGAACESYAGTPVVGSVTLTGRTAGNGYHWRARVKNNSTSETSAWVAFGANPSGDGTTDGSPANNDYYIDTTAPVIIISSITSSGVNASGATIAWSTDELADSQVKYDTVCPAVANSTTVSQTDGVYSHSVALSGLTPNQIYQYQVVSADRNTDGAVIGNSSTGPSAVTCNTFTTSKANMRTAEYIITGETSAVTVEIFKNFQVYITEQGTNIQSAFVEISGIAGIGGGASMTLGLRVDGVNIASYDNYSVAIDNAIATPFTILHKIDNSVSNLYVAPSSSSNNKFYINPSAGDSVYIASAKIVVTYYYTP